MQDLLSNLDPTIAAILIVAGVLALVIVVILTRRLRRRQGPLDSPLSAAPGLGGPVDYTSLPLDEEPSGWRERFARLSIAGKILVILVPILAILGVLVLVLALSQEDKNLAPIATPTPTEPVTLNVRKADVIRTNPITIGVAAETTGIADGTEVTVELLADGKPLAFLDPESTTGQIRRGAIEIEVRKLADAAAAVEGIKYNIRVSTTDGQASSELALTVPPTNASAFYGTVANTPTPTVTVEVTATPVITTTPEITVTMTPTATPVSDLPTGTEVTVISGV
ncbi:MAG: SH3 domain-containing protein, partial [Oscillochloris sp.]|nr:SH3 domain-containing protein [Oscillochloris sp.]